MQSFHPFLGESGSGTGPRLLALLLLANVIVLDRCPSFDAITTWKRNNVYNSRTFSVNNTRWIAKLHGIGRADSARWLLYIYFTRTPKILTSFAKLNTKLRPGRRLHLRIFVIHVTHIEQICIALDKIDQFFVLFTAKHLCHVVRRQCSVLKNITLNTNFSQHFASVFFRFIKAKGRRLTVRLVRARNFCSHKLQTDVFARTRVRDELLWNFRSYVYVQAQATPTLYMSPHRLENKTYT